MKTPHVHAAMIAEWIEDTTQVVEWFDGIEWWPDREPPWCESTKYRFRHKHQDLIDQKAARPELIKEWVDDSGKWCLANDLWWPDAKYRLVEPRHKHQDLIEQKAARPELVVQYEIEGDWYVAHTPTWNEKGSFRLVEPEPVKRRVKMWQWVFYNIANNPTITNRFFPSEEAFREAMHGYSVIQRADWTEIEVDA